MQIIFSIILSLGIISQANTQSISLGYYNFGIKSYIKKHYDARDKPSFGYNSSRLLFLKYTHSIYPKKNIYLQLMFSGSFIDPNVSTNRSKHSNITSYGLAAAKSRNFDFGLKKEIKLRNKKISLLLIGGIRTAIVTRSWPDGDIFKNELGESSAYSFPGIYFIPFVNIGMSYNFYKRWYFEYNLSYYQGLYGKMQELHFDYDFAGVQHPTSITYSNGTSWQIEWSIKYDLKRKRQNRKTKSKKRKRRRR